MRAMLIVVVILIMAVLIGEVRGEQAICVPREQAIEVLHEKFMEAPVMVGIGANGRLMEVYASPDGASWTILVTTPGGASCVAMVGDDLHWRDINTDPEA